MSHHQSTPFIHLSLVWLNSAWSAFLCTLARFPDCRTGQPSFSIFHLESSIIHRLTLQPLRKCSDTESCMSIPWQEEVWEEEAAIHTPAYQRPINCSSAIKKRHHFVLLKVQQMCHSTIN